VVVVLLLLLYLMLLSPHLLLLLLLLMLLHLAVWNVISAPCLRLLTLVESSCCSSWRWLRCFTQRLVPPPSSREPVESSCCSSWRWPRFRTQRLFPPSPQAAVLSSFYACVWLGSVARYMFKVGQANDHAELL
jgi:hypothetical protein